MFAIVSCKPERVAEGSAFTCDGGGKGEKRCCVIGKRGVEAAWYLFMPC